jgi:protease-4
MRFKSLVAALMLLASSCMLPPAYAGLPDHLPALPASDQPKPAEAAPEPKTDASETDPRKTPILETMTIAGVIDDDMATRITAQVKAINENPRIKAVLLTVNSPGGGVVASSAINEELLKLKVPVVAWCDSECASGGMFVLMNKSVKYIGARKETIVGSIGVIMEGSNYHRLLDYVKVDPFVFKSSQLKDAGNPTREQTPADNDYLQSIVTHLANDFYGLVKDARGDKITDWGAVKSARIFFGQEGVKVGLIDGIISYEDVEKKAKAISGAKTIFTRDEAKAISDSVSGDSNGYSNEETTPAAPSLLNIIDKAQREFSAVMDGESAQFEYLCPQRF